MALAVALLLITYDADSIIGHLISNSDWTQCRKLEQQWGELVLDAMFKNRNAIIGAADWNNRDEAEEMFGKYLEKKAFTGTRLIRYILEQATVNLAPSPRHGALAEVLG